MMPTEGTTSLPLFPLPNVVHFPGTDLKLHVFEPRYRRLVRDLLAQAPECRWIGMVLIKPGRAGGDPEVFPGGTAGLMTEVEYLADGRSNILLHGDFRFEIEREIDPNPYRRALVRQVLEPAVNEQDPALLSMRQHLLEIVEVLGREIGEAFPIKPHHLALTGAQLSFELMVNRIASEIDLPALAKMGLLTDALPERALHLLGILRSRQQVLEVLRPFRHLATEAELN